MTPTVSEFLQAALCRIGATISTKEVASTHVGIDVLDGQPLSVGIEILPAHDGPGFRACLHGIGIRGASEEIQASSVDLLLAAIRERMLYAPGEWGHVRVTSVSMPKQGYSFVPAVVGDSRSGRMVSLAPHLVDFLGICIDRAASLVISGAEEAVELVITASNVAAPQTVKLEMLQLMDSPPALIVSFAQHRYRAEVSQTEDSSSKANSLDGKNRVLSFLSTQFAGSDALSASIQGKTTRSKTSYSASPPGSQNVLPGLETGA